MRILHVTTFLQGGAGRIIASLAVAQRRAGHDVTVVTDAGSAPGYGSYPEYLQQLRDAGVTHHRVQSTFTRDATLNVAAAQALSGIIGGAAIDVAHTHAAIPTLVASLALGRRTVTPILQTMHGWGTQKTPAQAKTDITLLASADAVVTPSMAARETLRQLGLVDAPVQVIPYGLEPRLLSPFIDHSDAALFAERRASGLRIALCIGTIGERKNQALLVAALVRVPDLVAVFIGDGETGPLCALADALGVTDRVHVFGYRAEASRYLAHADLMVLPSRNEGLPIAVLEALRAGVPVVGSAIPEIAEAIDDGQTGYLFRSNDVDALTSALLRGVEPTARVSMPGRARAVFAARYELARMTAAYDDLYARLTAKDDAGARRQ